jgi:predicted RNA-binding Zn ribbon-like protein
VEAARNLRELLYRLFSTTAKGTEPDQKDRQDFVTTYGEAISHSSLLKKNDHYTNVWKLGETLSALLWPIIHSAGELLLSSELNHVKECPGCGWLFLDTSKNQSRRWCSMNTCGARDKMRRYHRKKQAQ